MNIIVPVAGRSRRFVYASCQLPKPLIPFFALPMKSVFIPNLVVSFLQSFTYLTRRDHNKDYGLAELLRAWTSDFRIACWGATIGRTEYILLLARDRINPADTGLYLTSIGARLG